MCAPTITTDIWVPTYYTPVIEEPRKEVPDYIPDLPDRTLKYVRPPYTMIDLPAPVPDYIPDLPDRTLKYVRPPYTMIDVPAVPEFVVIVKRSVVAPLHLAPIILPSPIVQVENTPYVPVLPERHKNVSRNVFIPYDTIATPDYVPDLPDRTLKYVRPPPPMIDVPVPEIVVNRSQWRRVPISDSVPSRGKGDTFFRPSSKVVYKAEKK